MNTNLNTLFCNTCNREFSCKVINYKCPHCNRNLLFPLFPFAEDTTRFGKNGIWDFSNTLPLKNGTSLGEGWTPLIPLSLDEKPFESTKVFLKLETGNPTGSFKDRGSALVASAAKQFGFSKLAIASTGNAGASLASYCAVEGLSLDVLVPESIGPGKIKQLHYFGAQIKKMKNDFVAVENEYTKMVHNGYFPAGPENPFRIEGLKTIAFEIFQQLYPQTCNRLFVPIGTGGLLTSIFKGFKELVQSGYMNEIPVIDGVQLHSIQPLDQQLISTLSPPVVPSVATGINIPKSTLVKEVLEAIKASQGKLYTVGDKEIIETQRELAILGGIGAEPTGVVALAAYKKALSSKNTNENVVIPITGHMLKE